MPAKLLAHTSDSFHPDGLFWNAVSKIRRLSVWEIASMASTGTTGTVFVGAV